MKIGFLNVGAPAGSMNAAVRAAVAYCLSRGHEPVAIHNGFAGFTRHHADEPQGSVRPFNWLEVDSWASKGGSEIGTNRELPSESGMELVANLISTKHVNDALFNLRQLHFGTFDMTVHEPASHEDIKKLDISTTYNKLRHEISQLDGPEALSDKEDWTWGNGQATFGHLIGGYDAG